MKLDLASRKQQWLLPFHNQSLGRKAGALFLLIFILAAVNIVVVRQVLNHSDSIAVTVNLAGKMRMLSQRMAYQSLALADGDSTYSTLREDMLAFEQIHHILSQGGAIAGKYIAAFEGELADSLAIVKHAWEQFQDGALTQSLAATGEFSLSRPELVLAINTQSHAILHSSDTMLTQLVDKETAYRQYHLMTLYLVFALDLLLLMLASLAVHRHVLRPLRMLSDYCQELISGNYAARVQYLPNDEIGKLTRGLNLTAQRTHELVQRIEKEHENRLRVETLFQGVADNAAVGVVVVLDDMSLRYANGVYTSMLDPDIAAPMYHVHIDEAFELRDRQRLRALLRSYFDGHTNTERGHLFHLAREKGKNIPVELFCSAMQLGQENAVVVVLMDVSERREAELAAREASLVFESTSEAIVVTDSQGNILNVNPAFTVITGYQRQEMLGANMRKLSSGMQDQSFYESFWSSLKQTGHWSGHLWNRRKDGQKYAEHLSINAVYDTNGSVYGFVGIFNDITQQKHAEEQIWHQAHYDALTGLPNRQYFYLKIQDIIQRAEQHNDRPVTLLFLDLDMFKEVNDTLGHAMGDELLRQVAVRLRETVRESDIVARLGGDEFTFILEGVRDEHIIERILNKVLTALANPFTLNGQLVCLSASVGLTTFPQDGREVGELLRNADLAMYAAKEAGRNQFRRFTPSMHKFVLMRSQLRRDLQIAITEQQFELLYQPIIDLNSGFMTKVEALLRWHHPIRGLLSPIEFITQAEESGLIREIGDWVFRESTTQLYTWSHASEHGLQMSINVSPVQLMADGIRTSDWLTHLRELGLSPECLTVEITESLLMEMGKPTQDRLLAFRDAGVHVALDDFGTGYSSLSYLNRFDIDYIKIDRSFVEDLNEDSESLALCQAIIIMAHKLGLAVIAEGVSTQTQCELLRKAGCDYAQGYLFAQPLSAIKIDELLDHRFL